MERKIKIRNLKKHIKEVQEILKFIIEIDRKAVLLTPKQAHEIYKFLLMIDDLKVFGKHLKEFCHERMNEKN